MSISVQVAPKTRSVALDAFRGAVMLLLIPDVLGGLSMYHLAARHPDSATAGFLARLLTHVQWSGCSLWDLVMPSFLFAAGMSMAYSRAARGADGRAPGGALLRVGIRSAALVLLGMLVQIPVRSYLDLVWPLLLMALGLPWSRWVHALPTARGNASPPGIEHAAWILMLSIVAAWIADQASRVPWHFHDILPQLGVAYGFAFLISGLRPGRRAWIIGVILVGYWLLFAVYPLPPPGFDRSLAGVLPGDEIFAGFFAHWNKGTNPAAAFDRVFLNSLPRPEPFLYNGHGYQTLNFVPTIVSVVFGVIAGEYIRSGRDQRTVLNGLVLAGAASLGLGWLAGVTVCPIVKSIWTPAWVLFSTGWVLLIFAAFYHAFELKPRVRWAMPFVVVGSNPLVLYVLALYYRPWILGPWQKAFGLGGMDTGWEAVASAGIVGVSLWMLAYVMYRFRIAVRL